MHKRLDNILLRLEDNKALDIVSIDLEGKSDIADFLVIATGTSNSCLLYTSPSPRDP